MTPLKLCIVLFAVTTVVLASGTPKTYDDTYANCVNPTHPPACYNRFIHGTNYNNIDKFRTIDGTCNNLQQGNLGATNTKLRRLLRMISVIFF